MMSCGVPPIGKCVNYTVKMSQRTLILNPQKAILCIISTSAVPVENEYLRVRIFLVWIFFFLICANNFKFGNALYWPLRIMPAKFQLHTLHSSRENGTTDRQKDRETPNYG